MDTRLMKKGKLSKVKILHVYIIVAVFMVIVAVLLMLGAFQTNKTITDMQKSTDNYIESRQAVDAMRKASDLLTEKSREFVTTGDINAAREYYKEAGQEKNREKSIKTITATSSDPKIEKTMKTALKESNKLAEREGYAMRLAAEGYEVDPAKLSKTVENVDLSKHDKALSDEGKKDKAIAMLFDEEYKKQKSAIMNDVLVSLEDLVGDTRETQMRSYKLAGEHSSNQQLMIFLVILGTFLMMVITAYTLITPIRRSSEYIKNDELLPLNGLAEYVYLAEAYNKMLVEHNRRRFEMAYKVNHDELTGLYNRKGYEQKKSEYNKEEAAVMVIDVDDFKDVNDNHGHDMGDKILMKVANALSTSFRSNDVICRMGGDEFIVIMMNISSARTDIIEERVQNLFSKLKEEDGLPEVTVSIGVAFNDDYDDNLDDLMKKADKALYEAKDRGKDTFAFYKNKQ